MTSCGFRASAWLAAMVVCVLAGPAWAQAVGSASGVYPTAHDAPEWGGLAIGMFDSGTGGLAILEGVLKSDAFDNQTGVPAANGDGKPDFCHERFVFLGDQANMPYGNYAAVGKTSLLKELILKDARFLLGREYYLSAEAELPQSGKEPIKALVIACNTATAYGQADIEAMLAKAGLAIPVIGVIDAGARGALKAIAGQTGVTIGVLATKGTVATGAYPAALRRLADKFDASGPIRVVQQGSLGLAGAIDGAAECVAVNVPNDRPRAEYRGPALRAKQDPIDPALLPRYHFDCTGHRMLWDGTQDRPTSLQINSVDNYVRYDLVSMLETLRQQSDPKPLAVIILGCTHFPYCAAAIQAELRRLYDYREEGRYVYRSCMASEVRLIDPAVFVARELYARLLASRRLMTSTGQTRGQFYITVPWRRSLGVKLDANGQFTYQYKYGRSEGSGATDVHAIPLVPDQLDSTAGQRLRLNVPNVWRLMEDFQSTFAR